MTTKNVAEFHLKIEVKGTNRDRATAKQEIECILKRIRAIDGVTVTGNVEVWTEWH